jgi:hypothetical protein
VSALQRTVIPLFVRASCPVDARCWQYPNAHGKLLRDLMAEARAFGDKDMDSATFQDAIAIMMEWMKKKLRQGDESARPVEAQDTTAWREALGSNVSWFFTPAMRKHLPLTARAVSCGSMRTISLVGLSVSTRSDEQTRHASRVQKLRTGIVAGQESSTATVDVDSSGESKRTTHQSKEDAHAPDTPFDSAAPSVVVLRTTGGCFLIGESSTSNLPEGMADVPLNGLAAVAISKLAAHGFSIASQSAVGQTGDELVYTLMRPASDAAQSTHGQVKVTMEGGAVEKGGAELNAGATEAEVYGADEMVLGKSEKTQNGLNQRRRHRTPRYLRGTKGPSRSKSPADEPGIDKL